MDEQTNADLGAEIAAARKAARMSKEAAAREAGVTTTTLRRAEAGLRVQDHKLAAILTAVGIPAFPMGGQEDGKPERQPFVLPAAIEVGYTATVQFSRAVAEEVPELAQKATRLRLDAAALFAAAGDAVYKRSEGGDGDADDTGSPAPIVRELTKNEVDLAAYGGEADEPSKD